MDLVLEDKNKDAGVVIVIESGQKQPKDKYMNNSVKALSILHILLISTIGEGIFFGI